jgi:hypothetical protein
VIKVNIICRKLQWHNAMHWGYKVIPKCNVPKIQTSV